MCTKWDLMDSMIAFAGDNPRITVTYPEDDKYEKWYQSGYMDNRYIPYVIMHGDTAVSSVAVCVNDIKWKGQQKRYVQISTVMTLPEYRKKGLNRYLMENVLADWVNKCDAVYLKIRGDI